MVDRVLGYRLHQTEGSFTDASALRAEVQRIYDRFQTTNSKKLPAGKDFVNAFEYDVCAALGDALSTPDGASGFEFSLKQVMEDTGTAGILAQPAAQKMWLAMLRKEDWYFDAVLVSNTCQDEGLVPGTSISESWHTYLKRYLHLHGLKGMQLGMSFCIYPCFLTVSTFALLW